MKDKNENKSNIYYLDQYGKDFHYGLFTVLTSVACLLTVVGFFEVNKANYWGFLLLVLSIILNLLLTRFKHTGILKSKNAYSITKDETTGEKVNIAISQDLVYSRISTIFFIFSILLLFFSLQVLLSTTGIFEIGIQLIFAIILLSLCFIAAVVTIGTNYGDKQVDHDWLGNIKGCRKIKLYNRSFRNNTLYISSYTLNKSKNVEGKESKEISFTQDMIEKRKRLFLNDIALILLVFATIFVYFVNLRNIWVLLIIYLIPLYRYFISLKEDSKELSYFYAPYTVKALNIELIIATIGIVFTNVFKIFEISSLVDYLQTSINYLIIQVNKIITYVAANPEAILVLLIFGSLGLIIRRYIVTNKKYATELFEEEKEG